MRFLNNSFLPATGAINVSKHPAVLHTVVAIGSTCRMQAGDFDDDGDLDLLMGTDLEAGVQGMSRYFERRSDSLEERTEQPNPFQQFNLRKVRQVADLDGDGALDVLAGDGVLAGYRAANQAEPEVCRWREPFLFYRRTAAGSFVKQTDDPMLQMLRDYEYFRCLYPHDRYVDVRFFEPHVADWNADGLPDFVLNIVFKLKGQPTPEWHLVLFQHLEDGDLRHNSQFDAFEKVRLGKEYFTVADFNGDGFEDVASAPADYQSLPLKLLVFPYGRSLLESASVEHNFSSSVPTFKDSLVIYAQPTLVDWDGDGDLELLVPRMDPDYKTSWAMLGLREGTSDPFENISVDWTGGNPLVVDWDNDGDFDVFLPGPDGRYLEQLADGSLHEWPSEQSPLASAMESLSPFNDMKSSGQNYFQFVDCDTDGDVDLIYVSDDLALACEQDDETREFRCAADFLCLGANLSQYQGKRDRGRFEISALGGQLKLFVQRVEDGSIELWTPGFCLPDYPCNEKGNCFKGHTHCTCFPGHEEVDCSKCQPHYHGALQQSGLKVVQDCRACPGEDGKVCYGRGTCFDDAAAQSLAQSRIVAGNGSCSCNEASFYGSDDVGRATCMEGMCPAGTEEMGGYCGPCGGGSFSVAGGICKNCPAGEVSLQGSSECQSCDGIFLRARPDATKQSCQILALDIILGVICWMTVACLCFLSLTGFFGYLPISDVSLQGEKSVITTSIHHYFLKGSHPVCFDGTGVPDLDSELHWKAEALNSYQLTLHGKASMPLDTSAGHLRLKFPRPFLATGMWCCPLIGWCLFFAAATGGMVSQLKWSLVLLVASFGIFTAFLFFALRRRQGNVVT